jgi:GNAT superfamily N-acetyltransferase
MVRSNAVTVRRAITDDDVRRCFRVMQQLRTHLEQPHFVETVRRQEAGGFRLAFVEDEEEVRAVAGYRVMDNLYAGRVLYVDDLVTDESVRSRGYGRRLLDWLVEQARADGCKSLELDSGVHRFDAHRFYLTNRMIISSHHFRLPLD